MQLARGGGGWNRAMCHANPNAAMGTQCLRRAPSARFSQATRDSREDLVSAAAALAKGLISVIEGTGHHEQRASG